MDKFLTKNAPPLQRGDSVTSSSYAMLVPKESREKVLASFPINFEGNLDDVNKLLSLARLQDGKSEIQQLIFSSSFATDNYRLLEVNAEFADQIEAGTIKLVFRGELDEFPVLCTQDKSYRIKEVETSNTLLFLPELAFPTDVKPGEMFLKNREIRAMRARYLEVEDLKYVSLKRLKELLHGSELRWATTEKYPEDEKLYSFDDLLDTVQMSEGQLRGAINRLPVIEYNGYLRLLSTEFRDRLLMELIECLDDDNEPEITIQSVSISTFFEVVKRREPDRIIPYEAVYWLVVNHCTLSTHEGVEIYAINECAICRSKASQLLRSAVRFELTAFEDLMKQLLPDGIEFKEDYLENLALVDEELKKGKTIRYLNVEDLPQEETERLELLFSFRPQWTLDNIRPFLSDICPTTRDVNELIARLCRVATINDERLLLGLK